MTRVVNIAQSGGNNVTMRNRIINGNMMIDQRNAGASVTPASGSDTYIVDRFSIYSTQASKTTAQQNQGSVTPPAGFTNYLGVTSSSAYSVISSDLFGLFQNIEGYNMADLGWGSANAQPITLSFWVRSSLTGTFGGAVCNNAQTRAYVFSYTINSANTWEYKTVTIAGDTTGTWLTTNGRGITLCWSLGMGSSRVTTAGSWNAASYFSVTGGVNLVGTNGATFYITGVQLEAGTTATPFEQRLYGLELSLCQRYFEKSYNIDVVPGTGSVNGYYESNASSYANNFCYGPAARFAVPKRATPTISFWNYNGTANAWTAERSGSITNPTPSTGMLGYNGFGPRVDVGAAWVVCLITGHWTASAEL